MKVQYQYNLWYPDCFRILAVLLVACSADFLLFTPFAPHSIPWTVWFLIWAGALWPKRMNFLSRPAQILWGVMIGIAALGVFWAPGWFAAMIALGTLIGFRILGREECADSAVGHWILKIAVLFFAFPFDALYQIRRGCLRLNEAKGWSSRLARSLLLWVLPILGTLLFLACFTQANPVLERWIHGLIEALRTIRFPSAPRCLFWCFIAYLALGATGLVLWQRIYPEFLKNPLRGEGNMVVSEQLSRILAGIITRGLLLFNLLFLIQNLLDVEYLWAGVHLPEGMSYAEYAHRGAYPLIVTALIAGGLTLLAFSGKCGGREWKAPRILVYVWLVQNVFLVASALLRLEKYVAVYSLTRLRFAAALWMVLIGVGLCLIFYKVLRRKSLRWLFWANGTQLLVVLLFVLFFDSARWIAEYNFDHCREIAGKTEDGILPSRLDGKYLMELLPSSLPVLLRMRKEGIPLPENCSLRMEIRKLEESLKSWRTWTPSAFQLFRMAEQLAPEWRSLPAIGKTAGKEKMSR